MIRAPNWRGCSPRHDDGRGRGRNGATHRAVRLRRRTDPWRYVRHVHARPLRACTLAQGIGVAVEPVVAVVAAVLAPSCDARFGPPWPSGRGRGEIGRAHV